MENVVNIDGFLYRTITAEQAKALYKTNTIEIWALVPEHNLESLVDSLADIEDTVDNGYPLGIEVGYVRDLK